MSSDPANAGAVAFKRAAIRTLASFLLHHDRWTLDMPLSSPDPYRLVNLIGFAGLAMYCRRALLLAYSAKGA